MQTTTQEATTMTAVELEQLEDEYNSHAAQAEAAPHKWGEEQEMHLCQLGAQLQAAYDALGTHEYDRVQL